MGDMVKVDGDFDAEIFAARAADFERLSHIPWAGFSVEGAMPGDNTDALPAIWDNWSDFQQKADEFTKRTSDLLAATASGDLATIQPAFMEAAKSCKGCHDDYRD